MPKQLLRSYLVAYALAGLAFAAIAFRVSLQMPTLPEANLVTVGNSLASYEPTAIELKITSKQLEPLALPSDWEPTRYSVVEPKEGWQDLFKGGFASTIRRPSVW